MICQSWAKKPHLNLIQATSTPFGITLKKQAAVGYLATKERRVWKSSPSFKNLDCSYEDFKAEVIKMYPEAKEGNYFSFSGLQELVSDRACKEIGSLQEFGKYYREFLLISRHLIAMGRIGVQEQERLFLRSFEPTLASAIYSRLETKFLDRTDRYEMEEILDAAIYVLKPQFGMSRVPLLPVIQRYIQPSDVSSPFPSTTSVAPAF